MSVTVLVATRDRPEQARATYDSFLATRRDSGSQIFFGVDYDEPQMAKYKELLPFILWNAGPDSGSLTKVTNGMLKMETNATTIGSVGDDHRFRTEGWDQLVEEAMYRRPGVVYPNDGFQRQNLATAFFVDRDIVDALGWLALPVCDHMYIDNAIMDIGTAVGNLIYLPNVLVEHLHPAAGKGIMDASYKKTNALAQMKKDELAYRNWRRNKMPKDVDKIRRYIDGS